MARISRFTFLLVLFTLAACNSESSPVWRLDHQNGSISKPGILSERFLVRPEGLRGPLVAFDVAAGHELFALPAGMLSANGERYYATEARIRRTALRAFDPKTGVLEDTFNVDGSWVLSGTSPTGRWLALTRLAAEAEKRAWEKADRWQTDIRIVDAEGGQVVRDMSLDGNFEVETLSADGDSLFLVQHLPAVNPDHYLIRLYDLATQALVVDPLRAKEVGVIPLLSEGVDEVMAGYAWEGVASPDGQWLMTLYLSTARNVAFVHALNLTGKNPLCIGLPSGEGNFNELKGYTLTLSPDGNTLYAANAILGTLVEVSLDLQDLGVRRQVIFGPSPAGRTADAFDGETPPSGRSVISKDGRALYFTSGGEVWAYDTQAGEVIGSFAMNTPVLGLGLSEDGTSLYVASPEGALNVVDIRSSETEVVEGRLG